MDKESARIIIIEDDKAMESLLSEFLELQGHRVESFRVASQALERIRSYSMDKLCPIERNLDKNLDLVISDINMPQMNGFEVLGSLRSSHPELPVILITAFGDPLAEKKAIHAGANAFLNKPFKLSDLREAVHKVLFEKSA